MSTPHPAIAKLNQQQLKTDVPDFQAGDTVKVHAKIIEGSKERIQVFEGVVLKRNRRNNASATFTVRKISSNIGVERTFLVHSPRIDKIEIVSRGSVRRARLFYLRGRTGKQARIKTKVFGGNDQSIAASNNNATDGMGAESSDSSSETTATE